MDNCLFCKIIRGSIPSYKIYENEDVYAFLDIAMDVYGHTLVIPKNHSNNIFDVNDFDLEKVTKALNLISNHYKNLGFEGINIMNANGTQAGQSIDHLHFHLIPRNTNDNIDAWPFKEKYDFDLEEMYNKLKIDS